MMSVFANILVLVELSSGHWIAPIDTFRILGHLELAFHVLWELSVYLVLDFQDSAEINVWNMFLLYAFFYLKSLFLQFKVLFLMEMAGPPITQMSFVLVIVSLFLPIVKILS
jgi:hypothetical protein